MLKPECVRLLNGLAPKDKSWLVPVPLKSTVPVPAVNVPPVWSQLPETVNVPEEPGAVRVPEEITTFITLSEVLEEPVNMPPETVRAPDTVTVLLPAERVPAWIVRVGGAKAPVSVLMPVELTVSASIAFPAKLIFV